MYPRGYSEDSVIRYSTRAWLALQNDTTINQNGKIIFINSAWTIMIFDVIPSSFQK